MTRPVNAPEYEAIAAASEQLTTRPPRNLPGVSESDATGEVADLFQHFRVHFGRPSVPGILQCFATHPPLLKHMMELSADLIFSEGHLGRRMKEMIATLVSSRNRCPYCADSHGFFLLFHGGSANELKCAIAGDLDTQSVPEKERILLTFACRVNERSDEIQPGDIEILRSAGWSDAQIAEAIHVTALFATYNRVANAFGLQSQGLLSLFERESMDAGDHHD